MLLSSCMLNSTLHLLHLPRWSNCPSHLLYLISYAFHASNPRWNLLSEQRMCVWPLISGFTVILHCNPPLKYLSDNASNIRVYNHTVHVIMYWMHQRSWESVKNWQRYGHTCAECGEVAVRSENSLLTCIYTEHTFQPLPRSELHIGAICGPNWFILFALCSEALALQ